MTTADDTADTPAEDASAQADRLTGIWHSKYRYPSSSRHAMFEDEHFVRMTYRDGRLHCVSLPHADKSELTIDLSLEGSVATGTWREVTSMTGHYGGRTYHGAIQLVADDDWHSLRGKWVGVGSDLAVNVGSWQLTFVGKQLPTAATDSDTDTE